MSVAPAVLREARAADREAIVGLWRAAGLLVNPLNDPQADFTRCRESGHGRVLLAEQAGEVVASVMVGHDGHRAWIWYLATHPDKRKRGLGRLLVRAAEDWARAQGLPKLQLLVRDTNTAAIGFYQRLGYLHEPREVLSRRLDGWPVILGGQQDNAPVVITYLEMTERPSIRRIDPPSMKLALLRANPPTIAFYRYLYDAVGRPWYWTDRKKLDDLALAAIVQDPKVDLYVLYGDGVPAGYAELDRRRETVVDLAYFGIVPEFIGRGLGPFFLASALDIAWSYAPARLTVNTCTLDHPKALSMYQRYGFRPYARREVPPPWARADWAEGPGRAG